MTDHLPAPSSGSWLSYAEAGERLGLSAEAVRRSGWRRMPGNDGRTLVLLPEGADEQPPGRSPAHGALIETLREAVSLLGEQLQAERSRADSARAEVEAGRARADADRAEIDRLSGEVAEKQAIITAAQAELAEQCTRADKAEQTVRTVQETAEELRRAEEARKARGRLRRAWDGWRGR